MNTNALCWIDQSIIPARDAAVSVYDHGLLYGDGIFEGLRFYHGRVFMLEAHLQRLQESARAINLELPCASDQIASAIEQLIDAYPDDNGYLRLVVTRGPGSLGIDPRKCERPGIFIIADELAVVDVSDISHGIGLHVAQTRRMPVACLDPKIKSLNYLNNITGNASAQRRHARRDHPAGYHRGGDREWYSLPAGKSSAGRFENGGRMLSDRDRGRTDRGQSNRRSCLLRRAVTAFTDACGRLQKQDRAILR
jgi:branched-subunit amino acid aminotransferase/4-amino-4-deoxychorismate lyase